MMSNLNPLALIALLAVALDARGQEQPRPVDEAAAPKATPLMFTVLPVPKVLLSKTAVLVKLSVSPGTRLSLATVATAAVVPS